MKFSEFLDLITWAAEQPARNVSAYLEYSSIPEYMPELKDDLSEFEFVRNRLTLRHLNIWLSDGNTLGRLHFDPFDNFLCQVQ
jgi:jumonji domain-containing protein 7